MTFFLTWNTKDDILKSFGLLTQLLLNVGLLTVINFQFIDQKKKKKGEYQESIATKRLYYTDL